MKSIADPYYNAVTGGVVEEQSLSRSGELCQATGSGEPHRLTLTSEDVLHAVETRPRDWEVD